MSEISSDQRADVMRVMRHYGIPDEVIAETFGISRQRAHKIMGPRPRVEESPAMPEPKNQAAVLAGVLKRWRERHGLTQTAAARVLGVADGQTIYRFETGHCSLPGVVLRLLDMLEQR